MKIPITIIANAQISFSSMGGSDKIFIEISRVWKKSGFPLTILGCKEAGKMCTDAGLGKNFQAISGFDVEKIGLFLAYSLRTITCVFHRSIIKEGILYSSSDFFPDLIFAFWQKLLNPKIKWVAGIFLIAPNPLEKKSSRNLRGVVYWLSQRIAIWLMKLKADLTVVLCEEDKTFLQKKGIEAKRIVIISGGINFEIINNIPVQEEKYQACFVGRFHQQKGIPELINIWNLVTKTYPEAKLAIIGWGDKYWIDLIRNLIEQNQLTKNIDLLGFLDNEEKFKVLKSSRIFLFPSSYESWGIVVAEAFGCGCPVVAFDIPATRKFNKGMIKAGLGDLKSFADITIKLLQNQQLYAKLSQEAKEAAKEFNWQKSAELIINGVE